ncbi:MAG: prepilin-type N-terminal cleavage/methylation domain-containing protein [Piscirickettsiaceae bacterium]|nr:prepilin-type N-terminal cleavage/methylation domain-containing protein [Piscirickettsiaceae bacterium]
MKNKKIQQGFTLIEMAIVLVIIGIILGAVSVGKDLQRNAENQKIYQKFVTSWKQVYDQYYNKTGAVLGDSQVAPTYMVNGFESSIGSSGGDGGGNAGNIDGAQSGTPDNYSNKGLKICHGQGYSSSEVGAGDTGLARQDLHDLIDKIGLRMPPGRAEGQEDRYLYMDSNGNPAELQICFQWNPEGTNSGSGNVMVLRGLTPDLARTLDQMIDGKPDSIEGRFRQQNVDINTGSVTSQQPGVEWAANNTYKFSEGAPASDTTGDNQDENRVILMTAHWAMDQ